MWPKMPAFAACSALGGASSQIHLATMAGLKILEEGGNAFDAAITISSVLTVLLPSTSSIGGDGFLLAIDSGGDIVAYNGSGRSPRDFPTEEYLAEKPIRGPLTITVPGLVDLWEWLWENYGSKDLSFLLGKAIVLARNGHYVQEPLARSIEYNRPALQAYESWNRVFGRLHEGMRVRFPRLAKVYSMIARRGADAFYRSEITEDIVEELRRNGAPIAYEDFADHKGERVEPIRSSYKDYELYELPPNTQGLSTLQLIKAIEVSGIDELPFEDSIRIRNYFDIAAMVYEDRDRHVADPKYCKAPIDELLSPDYLSRKLGRRSSGRTLSGGDTTFFVVADRHRNFVGFIQSVFYGFGSGIVAHEIPFQNRGAGFAKEIGVPNSPAPLKRPLHTLSVLLARHEKKGDFMIGCAGGDYRPQIHAEVFLNIASYGMPLARAVEAPRYILISWGRSGMRAIVEEELSVRDLPSWVEVIGLRRPGTGIVHAMRKDRQGIFYFVADPRGGGLAAPLM